jgi:glycosidase
LDPLPNPLLYQINTRVWLRRLSERAGRPIRLDDIPDEGIDAWSKMGFDWIWLLSVWTTGESGRAVSASRPDWLEEFRRVLPDLSEKDICGSGFAIADYSVSPQLGGPEALSKFRRRLADRGMRLMLDFVPNHTALDHGWATEHPGFYITGSERQLQDAPANYVRLRTGDGERVFAHGRDPHFPGWPDTLQLNYGNPAVRQAMAGVLEKIATQCDGVRCDMAMLLAPEVFERTWGVATDPFWPDAIGRIRATYPDFVFMAEVYWDMEWLLQQQGFDYCYDKRLYDRLRARQPRPVRDHLSADLRFQEKLARFLENHDEPRAAEIFAGKTHEAAAVATYLAPGLRFFHQGQLSGARTRISTHLCRAVEEPDDASIMAFYARLIEILEQEVFRTGEWRLLDPEPAWPGNPTCENFLAWSWTSDDGRMVVVIINYADVRGQCRLRFPVARGIGDTIALVDMVGSDVYERGISEILDRGLYVDLEPWAYNVFDLIRHGGA